VILPISTSKVLYSFFFSFGIEVWAQDLHLQLLYQPFYVKVFFWDRVSCTISLGWLRTSILLISASWVTRITDVSHWCPAVALHSYILTLTSGQYTWYPLIFFNPTLDNVTSCKLRSTSFLKTQASSGPPLLAFSLLYWSHHCIYHTVLKLSFNSFLSPLLISYSLLHSMYSAGHNECFKFDEWMAE
jgi:hypothetical protein